MCGLRSVCQVIEVIVLLIKISVTAYNSPILMYNTEDTLSTESYDCVYYNKRQLNEFTVKYCQRPGELVSVIRDEESECFHAGNATRFRELRELGIQVSELLNWRSSVEKADAYAEYLLKSNRWTYNVDDDSILCNCTNPNTFGKFCEYELFETDTMTTQSPFDDALELQFRLKEDFWLHMQVYGLILCYETLLECDYGALCLDWRDICDGRQQCMNGKDEMNCDKLEFNECERDEFRCHNDMCIPDLYFLDGDYDCMDWSDELSKKMSIGIGCPFLPNAFECDDHLCISRMWSCGDGDCITQKSRFSFNPDYSQRGTFCVSLRESFYICETSMMLRLWTMPNGMCWSIDGFGPFPGDFPINSVLEHCYYLIQCALSNGGEHRCPCRLNECNETIVKVCSDIDKRIPYPFKPIIRPFLLLLFDLDRDWRYKSPDYVSIEGSFRCRNLIVNIEGNLAPYSYVVIAFWDLDGLFCGIVPDEMKTNDPSIEPNCWANSTTFNGQPYPWRDVCSETYECISTYRIHDGIFDCASYSDERLDINGTEEWICKNMQRYRLRCSAQKSSCLPLLFIGDTDRRCINQIDEYSLDGSITFSLVTCNSRYDPGCDLVKAHLMASWQRSDTDHVTTIISNNIDARIQFRAYCDTFWDLKSNEDENAVFCRGGEWKCEKSQYQCQTGQCISAEWVCDSEWDCSDASDEEGIFLIEKLSEHNAAIINLEDIKEQCQQRYNTAPLASRCNIHTEYPCIRANVSDPFNFNVNPPCISLSRLGDGNIDCEGGLDERNILPSCANTRQLGFNFHCSLSNRCVQYENLCRARCPNHEDDIICFHKRPMANVSCTGDKDVVCFNGQCIKNSRCDENPQCLLGEDEYGCPAHTDLVYRILKALTKNHMKTVNLPGYPSLNKQNNLHRRMNLDQSSPQQLMDPRISTVCNRGFAVSLHDNNLTCFCPQTFYGVHCEYFSDRISIVTHINFTQSRYRNSNNTIIKIIATLIYFDENEEIDNILDHHQFHVRPEEDYVKHKFHLLYSRSSLLLKLKQKRYSNRTDIVTRHPYTIRFEALELHTNNSIQMIGLWQYSVYFDYLPSFRLAKVLTFNIDTNTNNPCRDHVCDPTRSHCHPVLNAKNTYVCVCKPGFYGRNCTKSNHTICALFCSNGSLCKIGYRGQIQNNKKPLCVCPRDRFGPRCYLTYDSCKSTMCLNNGTCVLTFDPSGVKPFICNCPKKFYGPTCEQEKITVQIHLQNNNSHEYSSTLALVTQFFDFHSVTLELHLRYQEVYSHMPNVFYFDHHDQAPYLAITKLYSSMKNDPHYYILYFGLNQAIINLTTTLSANNMCPKAITLLANLSDQEAHSSKIPSVFQYHRICQNLYTVPNSSLPGFTCFYDDRYLCTCQRDYYRAECFGYDHSLDTCSSCLSNGRCLRGNLITKSFLCLCPRCHHGDLCQFNMELFSFTIDSLIIQDRMHIQTMYMIVTGLLFFIGLFTNACSFVTFKRLGPRKVGVGNYMFIVTVLNQCCLLILCLKLTHILIESAIPTITLSHIVFCKGISYLLSVITRSNYWLTSWISIERLGVIMFPSKTLFKRPRVAITISFFTLIVILIMHTHELIFYSLVQDLDNKIMCVTDYNSPNVAYYNRTTVLIHYLGPFCIQIVSISLLIILAARSRSKTASKNITFSQLLIKQIKTQKELYLPPAIIIISTLPQTIIAFSFACTELKQAWQRYGLLSTYFFSYLPQILGFCLYVLPSNAYMKEFRETSIAKWLFKKQTSR